MSMVVCVLIPRFQLTVAVGDREELLGSPAALAPEPGREARIGEVSLAAEAFGVRAGMPLGEALSRCPQLTLVPPDPAGVADAWERLLVRLESIGAAVAPERPGLASFAAQGLVRLHGGTLERVLAAARTALRHPARIGAGPSRFCALAAATRARARRPQIVLGDERAARDYLAPLPVALLRGRDETAALPEALARLGVETLGELAALPRSDVADRFGAPGLLARELAQGRDGSLRPREAPERLEEELELPEALSGAQLDRALGLLVDRLLARHERRGRTLRAVVLAATLVEGGTWREQVPFREALSDPTRMRLALAPRLALLPAPAERLRLAVVRFGPAASDQRSLLDEAAAERRERLREGVRQARAAAGPDAALRVLAVDPDSRVPERRAVLTPFE
ncbi:protein ImuB [Conexibacter arvalis]|uniref:Protein ImuB n=2 Tax=Conexibacter arvalis TaxID=912552 RepID=A0A840IJR8_9ACTN|nr:protein ImuB [Conexibacter arvalis]